MHNETEGNFALNTMPWKKVALVSGSGRVCVRIKSTKSDSGEVIPGHSVWLDEGYSSFLYKTLQISQSVSIAFYVFKYHEPGTLEVIDRHDGRFPLPPRTFWDLPNLKAAIKVDYGTPKDQNSWVKRNWSAVKKLIEDSEYPYASHHFWNSIKSREALRTGQGLKPAQKAKLDDIGPSVIGVNCMELFCLSTLGVIYSLLHWHRRLLTDTCRAQCFNVLESFLRFALPDTVWTMVLNFQDFAMGVLPADGALIPVGGLTILDCTLLGREFPAFGAALLRIA